MFFSAQRNEANLHKPSIHLHSLRLYIVFGCFKKILQVRKNAPI